MVTANLSSLRFPPTPTVIDRVEEPIDTWEVLRYLGYPEGVRPRPRIAQAVADWIETSRALAAPRAIYWLLPIAEKDQRRMCVQSPTGVTEFRGAIGDYLGVSLALAVFIATAGPRLERQASQLARNGDELGAMILNAVGAERAEAAESVVMAELRQAAQTAGLAPTLPYSPGYCGMALREQQKLFALLDGGAVGVTLTAKCQMHPIKSISRLIGLGPALDVAAQGSPCDRCELESCSMRR